MLLIKQGEGNTWAERMDPDVESISCALAWPAAASTTAMVHKEFAFTIFQTLHIVSDGRVTKRRDGRLADTSRN